MATTPTPDEYGRYRVRIKGDTKSPIWSTRNFDPERHVALSGPASDSYGNALPSKPYWPLLNPHPATVTPADLAESETNTTDEESHHDD